MAYDNNNKESSVNMNLVNDKELKNVEKIVKNIIDKILASRDEILNILDFARAENENIKNELTDIKKRAVTIIDEVDTLEIKVKMLRKKLAHVSKNYNKFTEQEVQKVYEEAFEANTEFIKKKSEEKELINRRNQLELSLKKSIKTIESAEKAINQISIAVNYIGGNVFSALEEVDKESQMLVGIKILEAQENERKRISRDIHDGPAQYVSNILMKAEITEKIIKTNLQEGLNELVELKKSIKLALKEIRGIIYDLRPMSLDDLGLNTTIDEFVKKFKLDHNINIETRNKPIKIEIDTIIQVAIFRIIQEVFNNIKKHSKANNVRLDLDYGTKYIRLIIADDGVGFDYEKTLEQVKAKNTSFGLVGIIERVEQFQGTIVIDSSIRKGTSYNIKLPVNREVIKDENNSN